MENTREEKGKKLFIEGKIEKIDKNQYAVQGTKKYFVKKISGYWSCTCEDHFYRMEDCKHMEGCKEYEKYELKGNKRTNFFNNKLNNLKMRKKAIEEQIYKILQQNKEHLKLHDTKDDRLRKKHHELHNKLLDVEKEIKKLSPKPKTVFIG